MIFILKKKDTLYFNKRQLRYMLKTLDPIYQKSKKDGILWYNVNSFDIKRKRFFINYVKFLYIFKIIRLRTRTIDINDTSKSSYQYKIIDMNNAKKFRNVMIDGLKEKNKLQKFDCNKCNIIEDD